MINGVHTHLVKAYEADQRRDAVAGVRATGRPARPPDRALPRAGARALARIAARIDREAARRAVA